MTHKNRRKATDAEAKLQFKEILERKQRQQRARPAQDDKHLRAKGMSGPAAQKKIFRRKTG
ncbi:DUF5302 domain-containing protein [Streptomyces sp. NPDC006355]|uniref:DUF5302 domain-containing protein n=1 Tax=Streptomyces sp. NPDC006355 TaxID=3156758 RepID=UPI0033B00B5A